MQWVAGAWLFEATIEPQSLRTRLHLASAQASEAAFAFGDARFYLGRRVKLPRFLPKRSRLYSFASVVFEDGQTPNGVCQIQWWGALVTAIDLQGFLITALSLFATAIMPVNVRHMPNRMGQRQRIAQGAVDGDGFLIMLAGGIAVLQVPLNAAQTCERLCQLKRDASVATDLDRFDQIPSGIGQAILSSRLKGLL